MTTMFKYFTRDEFKCQYTGKNEISDDLIHKLDQLREACGFPFKINSGYRDKTHPIEAKKKEPGTHARGIAADIAVRDGVQRRKLVEEALKLGFNGVGVANSFIHVDIRKDTPVLWLY